MYSNWSGSFLACMYLRTSLYSPNVFGDAALINYANLCKFIQTHIKCSYFLISWQILFKFGIQGEKKSSTF